MEENIDKAKYENAKIITKKELSQAQKNLSENLKYELERSGTQFMAIKKIIKTEERKKKRKIEKN